MENKIINKAVIKDYDLPIMFYGDDMFNYFANLYDPYLKVFAKKELLLSELAKNKESNDIFNEYSKLAAKMIHTISSLDVYKKFNEDSLKQFVSETKYESKKALYQKENKDKIFCSIDMVKANYSVLRFYNEELVLGTQKYEELFQSFSNNEYLQHSKKFRQVVFGNLNPKKQQILQKFLMSKLKIDLMTLIDSEDIYFSSPDELVFEVKKPLDLKAVLGHMPCPADNFRVSNFQLKLVHENFDFFVKKSLDNDKIEFKNVPQNYLAQVVKYFQGQEILENDRKFMLEGQIATFDKNLFDF